MTTTPTALDLLKRTEALLSALHGSVARHDNLAANLGCAGCELRDKIRDALRAAAVTRPANAHWVRPIPPLPVRTRLRLAAARRIDHLGAWLCDHGRTRTAERIWRACRMI